MKEGAVRKGRTWLLNSMLVAISSVLLLLFALMTLSRIEVEYGRISEALIIDAKKLYLHDTVNNLIRRIETLRTERTEHYRAALKRVETVVGLICEDEPDQIIAFFEAPENRMWRVLFTDANRQSILYDTSDDPSLPPDLPSRFAALKENLMFGHTIERAAWTLFFGLDRTFIDDEVKALIHRQIHNAQYSEESYIWVNEILNWDGGDGYAIRKVHPNLPESEGMLLSTAMVDIVGNRPYKTELDGVRQDGELFFTYYFKRLGSDEIAEKLTYAKLYKDFDWIVAMGIHLDDLGAYAAEARRQRSAQLKAIAPYFLTAMVALLLVHTVALLYLKGREHRKLSRTLEQEVYQDALTGVGNRRLGEQALHVLHAPVLVALLDIDRFKAVNDRWGHGAGDQALIALCRAIERAIGDAGRLYRWGGDEFLVICPHFDDPHHCGQALLEASQSVVVGDGSSLTVSIGLSVLNADDSGPIEVIRRADEALYRAKQAGRNRYEILA